MTASRPHGPRHCSRSARHEGHGCACNGRCATCAQYAWTAQTNQQAQRSAHRLCGSMLLRECELANGQVSNGVGVVGASQGCQPTRIHILAVISFPVITRHAAGDAVKDTNDPPAPMPLIVTRHCSNPYYDELATNTWLMNRHVRHGQVRATGGRVLHAHAAQAACMLALREARTAHYYPASTGCSLNPTVWCNHLHARHVCVCVGGGQPCNVCVWGH